jgi:hypothetical protein
MTPGTKRVGYESSSGIEMNKTTSLYYHVVRLED